MDEKELVTRTRKSLKDQKSRSEILRVFQKKGYKLEYAEEILSKAHRPKKILHHSLYALVIILCLIVATFSVLTMTTNKTYLENPLSGLKISGNSIKDIQDAPFQDKVIDSSLDVPKEVTIQEIEVTPEFISYLLNEIGAWKLHRNPLTFEKPIINFKIGQDTFYSEVGSEINTKRGLSDKADLQFDTSKEEIVSTLASKDHKSSFKKSVTSGKTTVQILAGEAELFSKGYASLYNSLK